MGSGEEGSGPYKRALLKVSGENGFTSPGHDGSFDLDRVQRLAAMVKDALASGIQLAIVVGGGNVMRGASLADGGVNAASADYMGMLATVLNALLLADALERQGVDCRVQSAITIGEVCDPYIRRKALTLLDQGSVLILAAGTGNPTFTTDTAAAVRATELECDILLKATGVDGVYDVDPKTNPEAKRFDTLSYQYVIEKHLKVMDATAITLCREHHLPVRVFNLWGEGSLAKALAGQDGTIIE
jgi:uridylate kinase